MSERIAAIKSMLPTDWMIRFVLENKEYLQRSSFLIAVMEGKELHEATILQIEQWISKLKTKPMNEKEALVAKIKNITGSPSSIIDEDIICTPPMLGALFFKKLFTALEDSDYTFMVNKSLSVVIFKH